MCVSVNGHCFGIVYLFVVSSGVDNSETVARVNATSFLFVLLALSTSAAEGTCPVALELGVGQNHIRSHYVKCGNEPGIASCCLPPK